jgi:hypothetical protein
MFLVSFSLISCNRVSFNQVELYEFTNISKYLSDEFVAYEFEINQEYGLEDEISFNFLFGRVFDEVGDYVKFTFESDSFSFSSGKETMIEDFNDISYKIYYNGSWSEPNYNFNVSMSLSNTDLHYGSIILHIDTFLQNPLENDLEPETSKNLYIYFVVDEMGLIFGKLSMNSTLLDSWDRLYVNHYIDQEGYLNRYFSYQLGDEVYATLLSWDANAMKYTFLYYSKNHRVVLKLDGDYSNIYNALLNLKQKDYEGNEQAYKEAAALLVNVMLEEGVITQQEFETEVILIEQSKIRQSIIGADQSITRRFPNWTKYVYTDKIDLT